MELNPGLFSSYTADHYTPPEIVALAVNTLGAIDLDPCSNSKRDPVIPAGEHYTRADNGLSLPWSGRVYLNPPYGREIGNWVKKLLSEYEAGRVSAALALVPARVDTNWFSLLYAYPVLFVSGRLRFRSALGEIQGSAPFPSAIVYLGPDIEAFVREFGSIGRIYVPLLTLEAYREAYYGA